MEAEMADAENSAHHGLLWTAKLKSSSKPDHNWDAFEAVYDETFPFVRRFTLARVHDPAAAEDLVGEIFERALRGWHSFEHRSTPLTWVLGIARHVIADYFRRAIVTQVSMEQIAATETGMIAPSPERSVQRMDELDALHRMIATLSDQDQDLLALRYAAALPFAEIGAALGINEGTARVRLHRVLIRLRIALHGQEE